MGKEKTKVGAVQLSVMCVLWKLGEATAREITDTLGRRRAIAHSTVQTLLRQLEAKGAVAHRAVGRTFSYYPLVSREQVTRGAAKELVRRLFGGSPAGLVAHLLRHEKLSAEELREIRRIIEQKEREP